MDRDIRAAESPALRCHKPLVRLSALAIMIVGNHPRGKIPQPHFLPTTPEEMTALGWERPDIILVTGDSYIDSPYIGVAVIGRVLQQAGFRTAIIAQPDIGSQQDIRRLGEPTLFWGVTGGCVDSMVANYTATKKRRKSDDYTPGGLNNRRPDRAVIQYSNLIRRYFKDTVPIVLGGIEASLRRIAHYDFWSDAVRRSILFDAKADFLVYGMGEKAVVALAEALRCKRETANIPGLCYIAKEIRSAYLALPDFEAVKSDPRQLIEMFATFYRNNDPVTARGLCQRQNTRFLIQNPPADYLSMAELDTIHELGYRNELHPWYRKRGRVKALETIRFSIPTHRGCYGECNFCAISVHQGRTVRWRSEASVLKTAREMVSQPGFKGVISDAGGPTANMYGFECRRKLEKGGCAHKRCLFPKICPSLKPNHDRLVALLRNLKRIPGVKHVFSASGIRYDLILADERSGREYLKQIVKHHVSGQLKIAPEHSEAHVLALMGKPGTESLLDFKRSFDRLSKSCSKNQFLTYYLIAAYPGCTAADMQQLKKFTRNKLALNPEQVQIFTPTPSTYAALMYHTGLNPFSGEKIFVEKHPTGKERQKRIATAKPSKKRLSRR